MFGILNKLKDDLMEELYSPEKRASYNKQQKDDLLVWLDPGSDDEIDPFAPFDPDKIKGAENFRLKDIKPTKADEENEQAENI